MNYYSKFSVGEITNYLEELGMKIPKFKLIPAEIENDCGEIIFAKDQDLSVLKVLEKDLTTIITEPGEEDCNEIFNSYSKFYSMVEQLGNSKLKDNLQDFYDRYSNDDVDEDEEYCRIEEADFLIFDFNKVKLDKFVVVIGKETNF